MGTEFQVGKMKKLWRWVTVTVAQQHNVFNAHVLYT